VAIKIVSLTKLQANPKLLDYLDQEIQILKNIKHPNVVNLLEEIVTDTFFFHFLLQALILFFSAENQGQDLFGNGILPGWRF